MERLEEIRKLVLIFMDILGEGFYDLLNLKPGTYRRIKSNISKSKNIRPIKSFIIHTENKIQKFAKTQDIVDDNEIYCRDTGSDKLLVPFLFLDEYLHLLSLMTFNNMELMSFEQVLNTCLSCCNSQDDSYLQAPDKNMDYLFEKKLIKKEEYDNFYEVKRRSFRKEYYSVCRDVITYFTTESSFYDWPIRKLSESIKMMKWNDEIISSRTIDRMKNEIGSRRWASIKDLISIKACERFRKNEEQLKQFEIFQARLLMAHLLENIVNSYVLQKEYSYNNLVELLKKGIINKTSL